MAEDAVKEIQQILYSDWICKIAKRLLETDQKKPITMESLDQVNPKT